MLHSVLGQLHRGKLPPNVTNPKLNLKPNRAQFSLGAIVRKLFLFNTIFLDTLFPIKLFTQLKQLRFNDPKVK